MKKLFHIYCMFITSALLAGKVPEFAFTDRSAWQQACAKLPMNIDVTSENRYESGFASHDDIQQNQQRAWKELDAALSRVLDLYGKQLEHKTLWTDEQKPQESFYDLERDHFGPYAEKLQLQPGKKVIFHGDFHGDIHSFQAELQSLEEQGILKPGSFELASKDVHLAFLGDYVDRGNYGAEVIYTLLRLKLANPDNVLIVRGNHEDQNISDRYGFKDELIKKFGPNQAQYKKIYRLYNFLPVVAYVGQEDDYLQCCHGGLEYGYVPKKLLESNARFDKIGLLYRAGLQHYLKNHPNHHKACQCNDHKHQSWYENSAAFKTLDLKFPGDQEGALGFMWADFKKSGFSEFIKGRGLAANEDLTQAVLEYLNKDSHKKVRGVFRAHQHAGIIDQKNPHNLMYELIKSNGVYSLWRALEVAKERSLVDGLVWTFNTAPDAKNNKELKYGFDAYAILTIAKKYEEWKLSVHNPIIINRSDFTKPEDDDGQAI